MEFQFKKQQYQTDAVTNTVEVFAGQVYQDKYDYLIDQSSKGQVELFEMLGYRNAPLSLGGDINTKLLSNINQIQKRSHILQSDKLYNTDGIGQCALDIEMETGTGKTYVYINTIFELNKRYGWKKFIIVVPSIAIREGVVKSFSMLERHFFNEYEKKAEYFVYTSSNLTMLKNFASSDSIQVMIINMQAFNSDGLDSTKKSNASRTIFSHRDDFNSYRPIDVIAGTRPIVIIDEPQKTGGEKTQAGLKQFKPLFTLNYSATHKTKHNCIYALDAVDAFEQKLVKRISVKGFEFKNLTGSDGYMYLDSIIVSPTEAPVALLEIEVKSKSSSGSSSRKLLKLRTNDDLFAASKGHNQYKDLRISEIDPVTNSVIFSNGQVLYKGDVVGDHTEDALQRVQIRETIRSHFDKEEDLFHRGIKTLSLFFIDEVANYKAYDDNGDELKGKFAQWFEEEYHAQLMQELALIEQRYANSDPEALLADGYYQYLSQSKNDVAAVHTGYFSIDRKSNKAVDYVDKNGKATTASESARKSDKVSDDISAYELILRNKEQLLSFERPERFIFSHSALREGWDNPNVFQICTLRHTNSTISKRQEVGRGLRLCVNAKGERMDASVLGDNVHELNTLTVIANESYEDFVEALQKETRAELRERPSVVNTALFSGQTVLLADNSTHTVTEREAALMLSYFVNNDYIDDDGNVTDEYKKAIDTDSVAPASKKLEALNDFMHEAARSTYVQHTALEKMVRNENAAAIVRNGLNENFKRKEFRDLWNNINKQYFYTVHYDSDQLFIKAVEALSNELHVEEMSVKISTAEQVDASNFDTKTTRTEVNLASHNNSVKYDLVGDIAKGANITRRTAARILKKLPTEKFALYPKNPEQFIARTIKIIKEQKATMIVEHISYEPLSDTYTADIFTEVKHTADAQSIPTAKHITDRLFLDGNVELSFAKDMELAQEVCVYAKLPRGFSIPTPVGRYSPDWAVAFNEGLVKHIYFIAETKGDISSMQLRTVENAKIACAKKLFNTDKSKVRYEAVATYDDLLQKAGKTL